jgi:hypothetical protein
MGPPRTRYKCPSWWHGLCRHRDKDAGTAWRPLTARSWQSRHAIKGVDALGTSRLHNWTALFVGRRRRDLHAGEQPGKPALVPAQLTQVGAICRCYLRQHFAGHELRVRRQLHDQRARIGREADITPMVLPSLSVGDRGQAHNGRPVAPGRPLTTACPRGSPLHLYD